MYSYPKGPRFRTRHAFTLIELLTVIAIIGILAAILIPTVGKVRNSAQKARCVSQMRQWGTVVNLCANDYKSNIALFYSADPFSYEPYISAKSMLVDSSSGVTTRKSAVEAMSICPSGINGGSSLGNVRQYAFVVPVGLPPRKAGAFGLSYDAYFYKAAEASAPGKLLLMIEVSNGTVVNPGTLGGIQNALTNGNSVRKMQTDGPYIRHGGIAHGLFLDGHVGSLSVVDTDYTQSRDTLDRYFSLK